MSSHIQAQVLGLDFSNNVLSAAPPGSLARADNVNVNAAGLLEPRRGFRRQSGTFGVAGQVANSLGLLSNTIQVVHYGVGGLALFNGSSYTDYSTGSPGADPPYRVVDSDLARMRFVRAASNLYLNTDSGVRVAQADGSSGELLPEAGVPRGLDLPDAQAAPGATWFAYDTAVAYRYVVSIRDESDNLKQSAPSGRAVVRNRILIAATDLVRVTNVVTATVPVGAEHGLEVGDEFTLFPGEANFATGTYTVTTVPNDRQFTFASIAADATSTEAQDCQIERAAELTVLLPIGSGQLTTSHYVEVFRSEMSLSAADEPSDELFKVYEVALTAPDISAGYIDIVDITPEALLGEPLYTSPSQETLLQANNQPPIGRDLLWFAARLWVGNVTYRQSLSLRLLAVDDGGTTAPERLTDGDIININGTEYTAKTSPSAPEDFQLFEDLPTPELNIEATVRALVDTVNASGPGVYAYYASGPDDPAGMFLLEQQDVGGPIFGVSSERAGVALACWSPPLPVDPDFLYAEDTRLTNGLAYSKVDQPEAFPPLNYLLVGPANATLWRTVGLRDRLYCFTDDGIYLVSVRQEPFSVEKLAETRLVGADTVVTLGESVWALTDQGVVRINEAGVSVVSRPIESAITQLFGSDLGELRRLAFAVGHESARQYVLWLPLEPGQSTYCEQAFVYNTATQAWTRWTAGAHCAMHNPFADVLELGDPTENVTHVQRVTRTLDDYLDDSRTVTLSSSSGKTLTVDTTVGVSVGDLVEQGDVETLVESIVSTTSLTVADTATWAAGSITVTKRIAHDWAFNPITAGNPALAKAFRDCSVLLQAASLRAMAVDFSSDSHPAVESIGLTFQGWSTAPWGTSPWGSPAAALRRVFPVPNGSCAQLNVGMRVAEARAFFQVAGLTLEYEGAAGKAQK